MRPATILTTIGSTLTREQWIAERIAAEVALFGGELNSQQRAQELRAPIMEKLKKAEATLAEVTRPEPVRDDTKE